jgi:hypothetical protein
LAQQESEEIAECAAQLRLVQADPELAADERRRGGVLKGLLAEKLKGLPPANRKRFLTALLARFPVAGKIVESIERPPAKPEPPVRETAAKLLERFQAAAKAEGLSDEIREEMSKRLADAGFVWVDPNSVIELAPDLRKELGLQAGEQPRLKQFVKLSALETTELADMDKTLVDTFRDLKIPINTDDLRRTVARFLAEEDVAVEKRLKLDSTMLGAEHAALGKAGEDYGKWFLELAAPSSIEQAVKADGGYGAAPWQKSLRECCWEKYVEQSKDFDTAEKIDQQIRACLRNRILKALKQ